MKSVCLLGLVCASLFAGPLRAQRDAGWQRVARQYGWHLDYDEARAAARTAGKPLMVVLRCVP